MRSLTLLLALCASMASAAPTSFSHQGRLLDAAGDPVHGRHSLQLDLVDDEGAVRWTDTLQVDVANGYYSAMLGAGEPLDDALLAESLRLRIAVDGLVIGSPLPLGQVPLAARAASLERTVWEARGSFMYAGGGTYGVSGDGSVVRAASGGYGAGRTSLVVTPEMSPYVLEPGVHEFRNLTVQAGAVLTTRPFNGYEGGWLDLRVTDNATIDGTIDVSGLGYRGGLTVNINPTDQWNPVSQQTGQPGESEVGYGNILSPYVANGSGGGGGEVDNCSYAAGGGGGGHATAGTAAVSASAISSGTCSAGLSQTPSGYATNARSRLARGGRGGATSGDAEVARLTMGGGGGASASDADCAGRSGGNGGDGGGAIGLSAAVITFNGSLLARGADGGDARVDAPGSCTYPGNNGAGGGGAGGSVRLRALRIDGAGSIDVRGGGSGVPAQAQLLGGTGGSGWVSLAGGTVDYAGVAQGSAGAIRIASAQPYGDGVFGWFQTGVIDMSGLPGRFQQVDLFADVPPEAALRATLCTAPTEAELGDSDNCRPVAPSGAVMSDEGDVYARLRVELTDRSDDRSLRVYGARVGFGQ